MKQLPILLSFAVTLLVLLGIHTAKNADQKQMIMVYTEASGEDFPNPEVQVEDYYINGVQQEGYRFPQENAQNSTY